MLFFLIFPYEIIYFFAKILTQQGTHNGAPGVKMSQHMRGSRGEARLELPGNNAETSNSQAPVPMRVGKGCERCRNRHIRCVVSPGASACASCARLGRVCHLDPRFQFKTVHHVYQKSNGTAARYDLVWDDEQVWVDVEQPGKTLHFQNISDYRFPLTKNLCSVICP